MPALTGGALCFNHDPARASVRQAARRRGGQAKAAQDRAALTGGAPVPLTSPDEIRALLERVAGEVLAGPPSDRRARTIVSVALAAVRLLEVGDLAERLRAVEESLRAGVRPFATELLS